MYRLPSVFRVVLGVAAVTLVALLAYLVFSAPVAPPAAPAAASLTPPRPTLNPTALRPTLTLTATAVPVTGTIALTATHTPTATAAAAATPVLTSTLPVTTTDWKIYENREQGFRIKYPQHFTNTLNTPYHPEVLHTMTFYDSAKYRPGMSTEFPRVGLDVFANQQRLSVEEWLKARLFSTPGSNQYALGFMSYQIVRTLSIAGVQATRLTAVSGYGTTGHVILVPLSSEAKIIYLYYFLDPPTIEPVFELMALTLERIR